ncbi:hypothetical protein ACN27F_08125 [Solwaraspora sp. WMMB335]|uniref:hypothetical protein n=1 Tax=Solwaraspora sp. WMMB335 TaxID=3404118 RepID=UPI003B931AFE
MAGGIRRLLEQELAQQPAPPIGDLVIDSVRHGRRRRRLRRIAVGVGVGGTSGVAVATAAVLLLLPTLTDGGLPTADLVQPVAAPPAGTATPAAVAGSDSSALPVAERIGGTPIDASARPVVSPPRCGGQDSGRAESTAAVTPRTQIVNCPIPEELNFSIPYVVGGPVAPATASGALDLLSALLPKGRTSGYAMGDARELGPGAVAVQVYLDRGDGPAMIRLWVYQDEPADVTHCDIGELCYRLPDGGVIALYDIPDNCVDGRSVALHRADGIRIQLNLARCLVWNGRTNPPMPLALSTQEALTVVLDPRWGTELPAEYVKRGAERFTELPWTWADGG